MLGLLGFAQGAATSAKKIYFIGVQVPLLTPMLAALLLASCVHSQGGRQDLLPSFMYSSSSSRENRVVSVQQTWERNAGKSDAVREFKTFAVNYFHKVLQTSGQVALTESQIAALRYTADAWLQSARSSS